MLLNESLICDQCISNEQIAFIKAGTGKYALSVTNGLISDYQEGGYFFFLNPNLIGRENIILLFKMLQDSLILQKTNRMILININSIHTYFKCAVQIDILVEFSVSGQINAVWTSKVKIN